MLLFICTKISYKFNLVDLPNNRKIHLKPTAYTGGITLSIIYLLAILLFSINNNQLQLILVTGSFISIVGLIDDKYKELAIRSLHTTFKLSNTKIK